MESRREFLAGMLAVGICPAPTWADAGSPTYLSAAKLPDGSYAMYGLTETGSTAFRIPLPGRGHAAAAHPSRPEAVAFARRPGTFALVINCAEKRQTATLTAPPGRHFYGHGAFSADGLRLFTTENDYEAARGVIGVWDAERGYTRIGEFESGGIGPHGIEIMPDGTTLAVANGGIETHPDSGRTKINISTMRPNLSYVSVAGNMIEKVENDSDLAKCSIRHLAVTGDGIVAFAMQWQGSQSLHPPLLGFHRRGQATTLLKAPEQAHRRMQGYAGSVAVSLAGNLAAITSPRGGIMQVFDLDRGGYLQSYSAPDICGVSMAGGGFAATTGSGEFRRTGGAFRTADALHACAFDNHLVRIA